MAKPSPGEIPGRSDRYGFNVDFPSDLHFDPKINILRFISYLQVYRSAGMFRRQTQVFVCKHNGIRGVESASEPPPDAVESRKGR
jgi:hypothetical protein